MPWNELRKDRYSQPGGLYFITAVTADRERWFERFPLARLVILRMRQLHDEHLVDSLAFVLMPDHLHWLFSLGEHAPLPRVMNLSKGRCARDINACLNRTGPVWQPAFHDHALRAEEDVRQIARYIVANPLRAGLVSRLGDYPHWDAAWLA